MKILAKTPIKIALVGIGLWLGLLGALWIIRISNRVDWRGIHKTSVESRLAELAARPALRPVLWGEATDCNAFDFYDRIRTTLEEITAQQAPLIRSLSRRLRMDDGADLDPEVAAMMKKAIDPSLWASKDTDDETRLIDLLDARLDSSLLPSGVSFTDVDEDFRQLLKSLQPVLELVHKGAHCKQARRNAALDSPSRRRIAPIALYDPSAHPRRRSHESSRSLRTTMICEDIGGVKRRSRSKRPIENE